MKLGCRLLVVCAAAYAVLACSENSTEQARPQGAIPQHQLEAMEKAKAVEDTLNEADAERRAKADKDTGVESLH